MNSQGAARLDTGLGPCILAHLAAAAKSCHLVWRCQAPASRHAERSSRSKPWCFIPAYIPSERALQSRTILSRKVVPVYLGFQVWCHLNPDSCHFSPISPLAPGAHPDPMSSPESQRGPCAHLAGLGAAGAQPQERPMQIASLAFFPF